MASGKVDTTIARVLGVTEMPISVTSEAVRSIGKVEVRAGARQHRLDARHQDRQAQGRRRRPVDSLAQATTDPDDLKIGLVPFSQTVNVGTAPTRTPPGSTSAANRLPPSRMFLGQEGRTASTCSTRSERTGRVASRPGPMPYEATETRPRRATRTRSTSPISHPTKSGAKGVGDGKQRQYRNTATATSPTCPSRQSRSSLPNLGLHRRCSRCRISGSVEGDILKYKGTPATGTTSPMGYVYGPNSGCEIAPLLRLTSDPAKQRRRSTT